MLKTWGSWPPAVSGSKTFDRIHTSSSQSKEFSFFEISLLNFFSQGHWIPHPSVVCLFSHIILLQTRQMSSIFALTILSFTITITFYFVLYWVYYYLFYWEKSSFMLFDHACYCCCCKNNIDFHDVRYQFKGVYEITMFSNFLSYASQVVISSHLINFWNLNRSHHIIHMCLLFTFLVSFSYTLPVSWFPSAPLDFGNCNVNLKADKSLSQEKQILEFTSKELFYSFYSYDMIPVCCCFENTLWM